MHYYQFNIGDYKSHTEHLTEFEDLAYRRMLDWYYTHETQLPLDVEEIARVIRMRSHCDCIAVVLREFFERTTDGWRNHRADKEIAKTGEKSSKAKASAKARWEKKPSKNNELHVDADAMRTHSEGNATQDTRHITHNIRHKTQEIHAPEGVSTQVWEDFKKSRRTLRAAITQSAIDGIQREATKAGWSMESALIECCARGWRGFKAEWVADKSAAAQETTYQRTMREKYQTVAPSVAAQNPNAKRIDPNTFFDTITAKPLEIRNV